MHSRVYYQLRLGVQQRYEMAILDSEAQSITVIEQAIDDLIIDDDNQIGIDLDDDGIVDVIVNRFQAARRLRALGLVGDVGTPECEVELASDVHTLVTDWLAFWCGRY